MSPKLMKACSDLHLFGLAEKCNEMTEGLLWHEAIDIKDLDWQMIARHGNLANV